MKLLLLLTLAAASVAAPPNHRNPVLPGDFPDPSVIRAGEEYWATATSSAWAPIFPLLRSTDLVRWRQVGSVFQRRPDWAERDFWAPEIAVHEGKYFIYYTARKKGGPLCVAVATASRPGGPYTDHGPMVCQDAGSIDAVPVTGEDGKRYLVWKEDGNSRKLPTPLWLQALSADGTKLQGVPKEIMRNDAPWEGQLIEGPFIVRRNSWFYMFYSGAGCCGTRCNYALGVARARKLQGPWEKNRNNPILAGNDRWRCPGHGSIVEDTSGHTQLLYHAYHTTGSVFVGRQGLLDEVEWQPNGWPSIHGGRGSSQEGGQPVLPVWTDGFDQPALAPGWQWPAAAEPAIRIEHSGGSWLVLTASARAKSPANAVVGRAPPTATFEAQTMTDAASLAPGGIASLSIFGNRENAIGIGVSRNEVLLWEIRKGKSNVIAKAPRSPAGSRTFLRVISAGGSTYQFGYSADGKAWQSVEGAQDGGELPPWDLAPRVTLTSGGAPNNVARFDFLRISPRPQ